MTAPILTLDFKRDAFLRRNIGIWLLLGGLRRDRRGHVLCRG